MVSFYSHNCTMRAWRLNFYVEHLSVEEARKDFMYPQLKCAYEL